jgi:hypothetical protein
VFDRSAPLPTGGYLEQADGTAWMALFAQNMIEIGIQLAAHDFRCLAPAGGTPRWCSTTGGGAEIGARDHRRSASTGVWRPRRARSEENSGCPVCSSLQ